MNELSPRFWKIFFEVYENLPRQGPGNRTCAAEALDLCRELQKSPAILDLGCGVGAQTFHLTELTTGSIEAVDNHAPFVEFLQAAAAGRGLSHRIRARVGDMANPEYQPGSFDLIWSEGALYSIGLRKALHICYGLLRPGGYLSFTDAIWRKENPPPAIKDSFDIDYPTMGSLDDDLGAIQDCGFELIGHFTLPDEAWWDDFYTPMETRIKELRDKYANDLEASAILDQLAAEPEMHRRYSDFYAYEFFVARRPLAPCDDGDDRTRHSSGRGQAATLEDKLSEESRHLLPKCTQCANIQIDEAYKLEYAKEPETKKTEGDLF